jgi:hypothetical protein
MVTDANRLQLMYLYQINPHIVVWALDIINWLLVETAITVLFLNFDFFFRKLSFFKVYANNSLLLLLT